MKAFLVFLLHLSLVLSLDSPKIDDVFLDSDSSTVFPKEDKNFVEVSNLYPNSKSKVQNSSFSLSNEQNETVNKSDSILSTVKVKPQSENIKPGRNPSLAASPKREISEGASKPNFISIPIVSSSNKDAITEEEIFGLNDLDTWEAPLYIRKNFPYYTAGFDENGLPIFVAEMGRMDLRSLVEQGEEAKADLMKFCKQAAYNCIQTVKNASTEDRPVTGFQFLVDMEGLQYRQLASVPTLSFVIKLARTFAEISDKYAEQGYLINADFVTHQLINLMKPIMGRVISKMEVFGTKKESWLPQLRRELGLKNLPEWYGGEAGYKPIAIYG